MTAVDIPALFDGLIKNAVDFLQRSIDDFDASPKHSLISFCSALELFLKARLMAEHWALILAKPDQAKLADFMQAKFHSVSLEESLRRIENVTGKLLPQSAFKAFDEVRQHRNKLVHFFHPDYDASPQVRHDIEKQQCIAWFHLHNLITGVWTAHFNVAKMDIHRAESLMKGHRKYLAARFHELQSDITNDKVQGRVYWCCPSCGFDSLRQEFQLVDYREHNCLVCGIQPTSFTLPCPDCGTPVTYWGEGNVTCQNAQCGRSITEADVSESFQPPYTVGRQKRYLETLHESAFCDACEMEAVLLYQNKYLCAHCLKLHDTIYHCDYCGTLCAGDGKDSSWAGCIVCGGRLADIKDD